MKQEHQIFFEKDGIGHRKSISSIVDQKPLFEFEGFIVKEFDGWNMWIEYGGEGGGAFDKVQFLNILKKLHDQIYN